MNTVPQFTRDFILSQLYNICLRTDSYKLTHWKLMKPGTTKVISYLESRGGRFDKTMFFWLQYYLYMLEGEIVTKEFIQFAKLFSEVHFGYEHVFNEEGWSDLLEVHKGKLPVLIKAVPEGSIVPTGNVLLTMESTDKRFTWIVQYIESIILKLWYPITVATYDLHCKLEIEKGIRETGGSPEEYFFRLVDFGYRGVSSEETAGIGGACHLLNSFSTDNIRGILFAMATYNAPMNIAGSVIASEHSVATPFGLDEKGEREYIRYMISSVPKDKPVSVVGDSKNIYNFAWILANDEEIRQLIEERTAPFILRPDSGDPEEVLPKVFNILWDGFGGTINDKHFKVLNPCIRILQGDGIQLETIIGIIQVLKSNRIAIENLVFGSGGKLLQAHDRDEQRFAIKCCYAIINGEEVNVEKNPDTAPSKRSKKGRLKLLPSPFGFSTLQSSTCSAATFDSHIDALVPVFEDGVILKLYSWEEVQANIARTRKMYNY